MELQTALVLLVALGAVAYLGRGVWRTWAGSGCKSGCGCGPKTPEGPKLIAPAELLARVRAGGARDGDNRRSSDHFSS
jgi:hypothetical protein